MRFKRAGLFLGGTFLIIFLFTVAIKDVFFKRLIEDFVQNSTGCKMEMRHFSVNVLKTQVSIKDLIIFNPSGYEEPILLRAPEVYIHFNVFDYFKKRNIHLYTLVLDVREYFFIRNKMGQVNGDTLLSAFKTKNKTPAEKEQSRPFRLRKPREAEGSRGKSRVSIQIDKLTLRIGRIVSKDYSKEAQPMGKEIVFNIDETFDDVQDGYSLVEAVVGKEFGGSIFQRFFKFGVEKITQPVAQTIGTVKDAGSQAVEKTRQIMMGTAEENQE